MPPRPGDNGAHYLSVAVRELGLAKGLGRRWPIRRETMSWVQTSLQSVAGIVLFPRTAVRQRLPGARPLKLTLWMSLWNNAIQQEAHRPQ